MEVPYTQVIKRDVEVHLPDWQGFLAARAFVKTRFRCAFNRILESKIRVCESDAV